MHKRTLISFLLIFFSLFTSRCAMLSDLNAADQTPTTIPAASTSPTLTAQVQPPSPAVQRLIIWIDPIFAQDMETGGGLLFERITQFEENHPGIQIDVRIKERSGTAGMLETLATVTTAAPSLAPDLITLNRETLNSANLRGYIYNLDKVSAPLEEPEWYPMAVEASRLESSFIALPFGIDAEALVYRMDRYETSPSNWQQIITSAAPFLFPAGSTDAEFTLSLYRASGGIFEGDEGTAFLNQTNLTEVLTIYENARAAGILPGTILSLNSSEETWAIVHDGRAGAALAPLSSFLPDHNPETEAMIPIPVSGAPGLTLGKTWSWALTTENTTKTELISELLAWLTAPEFVGPWTESMGFLPPSPAALEFWTEPDSIALANRLINTIQPQIPVETTRTFGPAVQDAVEAVVNGTKNPDVAAMDVYLEILNP